MIDDDLTALLPSTTSSTTTYWAPPRLAVRVELRAGIFGVYVRGATVYWCPVPFVVLVWNGSMRGFGLALALPGVLTPLLGLPWQITAAAALYLVAPGFTALFHAWLRGRLWRP